MSAKNTGAGVDPKALALLLAATVLCLVPFLGKAFNIDEPLFIWAARHIQSDPLNFYNFTVNWYGTAASASRVIKNPPLASYYLALAGSLGGWREAWLHFAFLVPALAAAAGSYRVAQQFSAHPLVAALISLLTPVFVVSSATVMCDTFMVAFFVWSVYFWVKGTREDSYASLLIASLLVALSSLSKYFGISLLPLLFAFSVSSRKTRQVVVLLAPVLLLALYQWWTTALYGRGLLLDAASYASSLRPQGIEERFSQLLTGFSFLGGCLIPTFLLAPLVWGRRALYLMAVGWTLLLLVLSLLYPLPADGGPPWGYYLQVALFIVTGIQLLALAAYDLWKSRNAESLLLALWVYGTFVFASFINWTANGRSILPLAPAVAILVVRAMERRGFALGDMAALRSWRVALPLVVGFAISIAVASGDYSLAGSARTAADKISRTYPAGGQPLQFQGHWGFQYYMQAQGITPWDARHPAPAGTLLVIPANNTINERDKMVRAAAAPVGTLKFSGPRFVTTMSEANEAGFYSSVFGTLPFAAGKIPDERYDIVQVR